MPRAHVCDKSCASGGKGEKHKLLSRKVPCFPLPARSLNGGMEGADGTGDTLDIPTSLDSDMEAFLREWQDELGALNLSTSCSPNPDSTTGTGSSSEATTSSESTQQELMLPAPFSAAGGPALCALPCPLSTPTPSPKRHASSPSPSPTTPHKRRSYDTIGEEGAEEDESAAPSERRPRKAEEGRCTGKPAADFWAESVAAVPDLHGETLLQYATAISEKRRGRTASGYDGACKSVWDRLGRYTSGRYVLRKLAIALLREYIILWRNAPHASPEDEAAKKLRIGKRRDYFACVVLGVSLPSGKGALESRLQVTHCMELLHAMHGYNKELLTVPASILSREGSEGSEEGGDTECVLTPTSPASQPGRTRTASV